MNRLWLVGTIILAVILQVSVLPVHLATPFRPDLLLIVVVYLALRDSIEVGFPVAWLLGLLKDIFSGIFLGLNAFSFLLVFLVIKGVADRVYAESGFLFVVTVSVATVACVTIDFLLLCMFTQTPGIFYTMSVNLIPHILINAFSASLVSVFPGFTKGQEIA